MLWLRWWWCNDIKVTTKIPNSVIPVERWLATMIGCNLVVITAHPRIICETSRIDATESFTLKLLFLTLAKQYTVKENSDNAKSSTKNR